MSCNAPAHNESLIDRLPEPEVIRERLGRLLRESHILRRLLPLAEKAAEERRQDSQAREEKS